MIKVLRLSHRPGRDARISTHVGLVARAFGADEIIYSGQKDEKMMNSIKQVAENFGGDFKVSYSRSWKKIVKQFPGKVVHMTMYGDPLSKRIGEVKEEENLLIVVGGEKVPGEIYELADWDISITDQPHSEVAAVGIILNELTNREFI